MKWILFCLSILMSNSIFATTITITDKSSTQFTISQEQILQLPHQSINTDLPWIEGKSTFIGVELEDLLKIVGIEMPQQVTFVALNNYKVSVQKDDFLRYKPIIAFKKDGQFMSVRKKGPYWLIFPLSENKEIDNTSYHAKMIWQIKEIKL